MQANGGVNHAFADAAEQTNCTKMISPLTILTSCPIIHPLSVMIVALLNVRIQLLRETTYGLLATAAFKTDRSCCRSAVRRSRTRNQRLQPASVMQVT
jgi:hypothetical protein